MRPDWDTYFILLARAVAARSSCPRLAVGAVLVGKDRALVSTGYNGAPRGLAQCDEVGCLMDDNHCVRAVHGELNALLQAARDGRSVDGATLYLTHPPCVRCAGMLAQAGVREVVYALDYSNLGGDATAILAQAGVSVRRYAPISFDTFVDPDDGPTPDESEG